MNSAPLEPGSSPTVLQFGGCGGAEPLSPCSMTRAASGLSGAEALDDTGMSTGEDSPDGLEDCLSDPVTPDEVIARKPGGTCTRTADFSPKDG